MFLLSFDKAARLLKELANKQIIGEIFKDIAKINPSFADGIISCLLADIENYSLVIGEIMSVPDLDKEYKRRLLSFLAAGPAKEVAERLNKLKSPVIAKEVLMSSTVADDIEKIHEIGSLLDGHLFTQIINSAADVREKAGLLVLS